MCELIITSFNIFQEHHDLLLATLPAAESALEVQLAMYPDYNFLNFLFPFCSFELLS